ncbi:MAG: PAS domain-containing protein, partial [Bryobacterales bacterium]|nr:PAS domain-containing protein [Bryobacterales bacterium]
FRGGKLDQLPGISGAQNMTDDRNGGFWVMTNQGLFHVRGGRITRHDQAQGPLRDALDVYQDSTGTLWFAANDGGLFRLRDGRLKAIIVREGLSNSVLLRFLDDGKSSLWISSHQSIFRLSLKDLDDFADGRLSSILPVSYGIAEGMRSSDCNWGNPGIWKTTDGRIWFPTVRGVVAIDPNAGSRLPPSVVLEEAWANKVPLRHDGTSAPAGNNTFDFQFAALSLSAPDKVRFRYRLEPYDKDWVDAGNQRTAHYTNMAPGEYSFQVIAASSFGVWNGQAAGVRFVLQPHYYQNNWFRALCTTAFLALLVAAYQLRIGQLQRGFKKLQGVIDTIPGYVWSARPDGSIDFINKRWLEFSGFSLDQGLGWGWTEAIHPEDRDRFIETWRTAYTSGQAMDAEARVRRADGQYRWLLIRNVPLLDKKGRIIKWYGKSTDIDERKRAEQALRRSEAYLADAQRLTRTGAWASDGTTRPLYWSEEVFRIFGFDPEQGLPSADQPLQRVHPEDRDQFWRAFQRTIQEKVDSELEYRVVLPDGEVTHVHALAHPVVDPQGELVEVVGTIVDVTDRKRAEEERERLRQLEADLAHINRVSMTGELTASIAHEVNQPLTGIVSNGSACLRFLAGDRPNLEEVREAVRDIVRDGKRAGEVIARIRALTKRAAPPREDLDLNETIRDVLSIVGDEAKRNRVVIRTHFADDCSHVFGDRVQLQQVLLNLVMNAMEAMSSVEDRERQLVITTSNAEPGLVQVTVEDSGTGLDPNTMARIFEPFYTTKSGGMGMGLSISRSIVQNHGGRLWATANEGAGTSFHFTLAADEATEEHGRTAAV